MRNVLLTFSLLLCFGMSFGQLKVVASGNVGVNNATPDANAVLHINNRATGEFVLRTTSTGGNTLFDVQEGGIGAGNFFIYDNTGTKTIQFAGQGKFFIDSPGNVGIDQQNPSFDFEVNGVAAKPGGGMWTATSDKRSKSSVNKFKGGLEEIMQIRPVIYTYNGKFGTPNNGKEYVGVVAQELQKVAPFMVESAVYNDATLEEMETPGYDASKDNEEFLAVDPTAFTYMLINSVQEQQSLIEAQAEKIAQLEEMINNISVHGIGSINQSEVTLNYTDLADLQQNTPNPFNGSTTIQYAIPSKANTASLNIYDMNGKLLKSIAINHVGEGQLTVNANDIPSGTYTYQLVVDGTMVSTKKMVLSK